MWLVVTSTPVGVSGYVPSVTNLGTLRKSGTKVIKKGCYAVALAPESTSEAAVRNATASVHNRCEFGAEMAKM